MTAAKKGVVFDLDAWQPKDDDVVADPFVFKLAGRDITIPDPRDALEWQDAASASYPVLFRQCLASASQDDADFFLEQKVTVRRLEELIRQWVKHYRLNDTFGPQQG